MKKEYVAPGFDFHEPLDTVSATYYYYTYYYYYYY